MNLFNVSVESLNAIITFADHSVKTVSESVINRMAEMVMNLTVRQAPRMYSVMPPVVSVQEQQQPYPPATPIYSTSCNRDSYIYASHVTNSDNKKRNHATFVRTGGCVQNQQLPQNGLECIDLCLTSCSTSLESDRLARTLE